MDGVEEAASQMDSAGMERSLQVLEQEMERASAIRPPGDEALSSWQARAEECRRQLQATKCAGTPRMLRRVDRFLSELADVRQRKARYLARRRAVEAPELVVLDTFAPKEFAHLSPQVLASGIRNALRVDSSPDPVPRAATAPREGQSSEAELRSRLTLRSTPSAARGAASPDRPVAGELSDLRQAPVAASRSASPVVANVVPIRSLPRMSRRVDPIMAIEGRLARPDSFADAREVALQWLRHKGFRPPVDINANFEIEDSRSKGHTASAVSLPPKGLWALQVETADLKLERRRWRVEMVLLDAAPTPAVSVTLTAISPAGAPEPPTSIPGLAKELVRNIGLLDVEEGTLLNAGPTLIHDTAGLQRALYSLVAKQRRRPIIVLSTYLKDGRKKQLLDPETVSRNMGGLAQVFVLARDLVWPFNEAVGRKAAVAGAGVRMYRPGFTPDDEQGKHPYWSPNELTAQGLGLQQLNDWLLREAAGTSLRALERGDAIPAFERVRELVLRNQIDEVRRRAHASPKTDGASEEVWRVRLDSEIQLRKLFEEDNDTLRATQDRLLDERATIRNERDSLQGRVLHLTNRVKELEQRLKQEMGSGEPEFPTSWDELEEWCDEHLENRVVLTRKAVRAAQDSLYQDVAFTYRALWLLAEHYVAARRGGGEAYKQEFARYGLEISPVGKAAQERRSRETYSTDYKRQRLSLDWHVKGSNDRDPRLGFRIYFHWHELEQCVVVGWLPGHLDNALS